MSGIFHDLLDQPALVPSPVVMVTCALTPPAGPTRPRWPRGDLHRNAKLAAMTVAGSVGSGRVTSATVSSGPLGPAPVRADDPVEQDQLQRPGRGARQAPQDEGREITGDEMRDAARRARGRAIVVRGNPEQRSPGPAQPRSSRPWTTGLPRGWMAGTACLCGGLADNGAYSASQVAGGFPEP